MKKVLTFLIVMFLLNTKVSASSLCSYQEQSELNNKAANVSVSYETITESSAGDLEGYEGYIENYFKISIVNVTEDFYVEVKNDYNKEKKLFYSSDAKDGIISFNWDNISSLTTFTIQVYSTDKTNCPNEKYKTFYLTTPRYNEYANREVCLENPEFYLCQKFVTFQDMDNEEFVDQMISYIQGDVDKSGEVQETPQETTITDIIFNFINEYKWFILIGLLVITLGGVAIYKGRTKKQRELGL